MALPATIFTLLSAPAIKALVGNRIMPVFAVLDTPKPYLIYKINALTPTETKDSADDMDLRSFSIMCFHEDYNALHILMDTIRATIVRTHDTIEGIKIDSIIMKNQEDDYDTDDNYYYGVQDFTMRING